MLTHVLTALLRAGLAKVRFNFRLALPCCSNSVRSLQVTSDTRESADHDRIPLVRPLRVRWMLTQSAAPAL